MEKREGVKRVLITSIGGGKIENKDGEKVLKDYEDKKRKWRFLYRNYIMYANSYKKCL